MLFADTALAARIDRAEARLCADVAAFVATRRQADTTIIPISGGLATYVSPASPLNKVICLAMDSAFDLPALERIEAEWDRRREPVRIELSILADPSAGGVLTGRGYRLHGFENVLGLPLDHWRDDAAVPGVTVDVTRDAADERTWLDIGVEAFMNLDGTGSVADDALSREQLAAVIEEFAGAPGFTRYLARLEGTPVGEAAMRVDGDVAQLSGAGTLPHARGRGVQKALVQQRLSDARRAGCTIAVVTTAPGTRSQANVMRRGFQLLYTRAILIRPAAPGNDE